ncbi:MAG: monovalent cation/H+ antiporter subunit D family protein [Thermodesulfobacteriota bacterium]|nr:monovalent cation/H+ antiporter subunit D family protein [Thermodesulfobacteriota bacterium]
MEITESIQPLLVVSTPLLCALLIVLFGRWPNFREFWTIAASLVTFFLVASMVKVMYGGNAVACRLIEVYPGVDIAFKVDAFGIFFALLSSFLWIIVSFYSIGYMRSLNEHSQTRFFAFFAVAISSALGVAFSSNLLTLYLFYELLTVCTYPLVTHHQDTEAKASGRMYLSILLGTSVAFFLPAILFTYFSAGTLDFSPQGILKGTASNGMITIIFLLYLFGIGKSAIMPFSGWLPRAMVAPTPVSALLHAVAVVKAGVFCQLRIYFNTFGVDLLHTLSLDVFLIYFVSITIIVGSLFALKQDDIKAMLAYSTISQLSYIILAGGIHSYQGMLGGVLHIVMHGFGKITLFLCAGSILCGSHIKKISQLGGIGRKMPITMLAFLFGALSVAGIPPFGGFISKWFLALGSIKGDQWPILVVLFTSTLLNLSYFMPVVYISFFGEESEMVKGDQNIHESSLYMVVPLMFTALISLVMFFYPYPFIHLAEIFVKSVMGG